MSFKIDPNHPADVAYYYIKNFPKIKLKFPQMLPIPQSSPNASQLHRKKKRIPFIKLRLEEERFFYPTQTSRQERFF